jgi:hypothetical protein
MNTIFRRGSGPRRRTAFRIHKSDLSLRPIWHQQDTGRSPLACPFFHASAGGPSLLA